MVIGITGGIASGKSYVSNVIKEQGYVVIDADIVSKELSETGNAVFNAIIKAFGKEYLDENGNLNRKALGELVFNDEKSLKLLNEISHPLIIEEIKRRVNESNDELVFVDVPLLYESNMEHLFDKIICVYLPKAIQIERLMNRDKISYEYAIKKIESQMNLEQKKNMADFVINSSNSFDYVKENVIELIKTLKEV